MNSNIKEAKSIVEDKKDIDYLLDAIEETLRQKSERHRVDLEQRDVLAVQEYLIGIITRNSKREEKEEDNTQKWLNQLLEEFENPKSREAHTNVSTAIGVKSTNNDTLRELANEEIREDRR